MSTYPPRAFHFRVTFVGASGVDASFQEVSGIGATIEVEKVKEGGQDDRILPIGTSYTNLVLKRGITGIDSKLVTWCNSWLNSWRIGKGATRAEGDATIVPRMKNVLVDLLDETHKPLHSWSFVNAYPVKWNLGAFNAQENQVAVETIELAYQYWERIATARELAYQYWEWDEKSQRE